MVEFIETATFSVAVITFGTAPCRLAHANACLLSFTLAAVLKNTFTLVRLNAVSSERDLLGKLRDIF